MRPDKLYSPRGALIHADATREAYYRADPKSLKAEYQNTLFITIGKPLDVSESEEFKRIKAEHSA